MQALSGTRCPKAFTSGAPRRNSTAVPRVPANRGATQHHLCTRARVAVGDAASGTAARRLAPLQAVQEPASEFDVDAGVAVATGEEDLGPRDDDVSSRSTRAAAAAAGREDCMGAQINMDSHCMEITVRTPRKARRALCVPLDCRCCLTALRIRLRRRQKLLPRPSCGATRALRSGVAHGRSTAARMRLLLGIEWVPAG